MALAPRFTGVAEKEEFVPRPLLAVRTSPGWLEILDRAVALHNECEDDDSSLDDGQRQWIAHVAEETAKDVNADIVTVMCVTDDGRIEVTHRPVSSGPGLRRVTVFCDPSTRARPVRYIVSLTDRTWL